MYRVIKEIGLLKPYIHDSGYFRVELRKDKKDIQITHRLLAEAFIRTSRRL